MAKKINKEGLELIKKSEGLRLVSYRDSGGVYTIGWGHTQGVQRGMVINLARANSYLLGDIAIFEDAINKLVTVPLTCNQFSALVSFVFNIGIGAFKRSTLLKKLNLGDYIGASEQFKRWNKDNGKVYQGLVTRRKEEMNLFLKQ